MDILDLETEFHVVCVIILGDMSLYKLVYVVTMDRYSDNIVVDPAGEDQPHVLHKYNFLYFYLQFLQFSSELGRQMLIFNVSNPF